MSPPGRKRCSRCKLVKAAEEFFVQRDKRREKDYLSAACRPCTVARNRELRARRREAYNANARAYRARNRDRINAQKRARGIAPELVRERNLRAFGLTPQQYDELLEAQGGVCGICKGDETAILRGKVKALAVDHCHETGAVRGLLCTRCNPGLGWFRHDPALLRAAADYLEAHAKVRADG